MVLFTSSSLFLFLNIGIEKTQRFMMLHVVHKSSRSLGLILFKILLLLPEKLDTNYKVKKYQKNLMPVLSQYNIIPHKYIFSIFILYLIF